MNKSIFSLENHLMILRIVQKICWLIKFCVCLHCDFLGWNVLDVILVYHTLYSVKRMQLRYSVADKGLYNLYKL